MKYYSYKSFIYLFTYCDRSLPTKGKHFKFSHEISIPTNKLKRRIHIE